MSALRRCTELPAPSRNERGRASAEGLAERRRNPRDSSVDVAVSGDSDYTGYLTWLGPRCAPQTIAGVEAAQNVFCLQCGSIEISPAGAHVPLKRTGNERQL